MHCLLLSVKRGRDLFQLLSSSPSVHPREVIEVLEQFLQEGRISALMWEVCQQQAQAGSPELQEALLNKIVCLPDHVSNKLQGKNPAVFFPQNYFPLLGGAIIQVLQKISDYLRGKIAGRLCYRGGSSSKVFCAWDPLGWCLKYR